MPTSAIAATTEGLTWSAGMLPAERTSTCPPLRWDRNPAAICERPALCTQTNRTLGLSAIEGNTFQSWVRRRGGIDTAVSFSNVRTASLPGRSACEERG